MATLDRTSSSGNNSDNLQDRAVEIQVGLTTVILNFCSIFTGKAIQKLGSTQFGEWPSQTTKTTEAMRVNLGAWTARAADRLNFGFLRRA
jgi:hypothetical protein